MHLFLIIAVFFFQNFCVLCTYLFGSGYNTRSILILKNVQVITLIVDDNSKYRDIKKKFNKRNNGRIYSRFILRAPQELFTNISFFQRSQLLELTLMRKPPHPTTIVRPLMFQILGIHLYLLGAHLCMGVNKYLLYMVSQVSCLV